jgi:glycosyltransferase involved in cell wall biosynthesis
MESNIGLESGPSVPEVSVAMAVYNGAAYLKDTLDSLLAQTFRSYEVMMVNDGSSDDTSAIMQSYAGRDARFVYIDNGENRGLVYSLNKAVALARGTYIARMDGDDLCEPTRLEEQVDWLKAHPGVDLVATWVALIDKAGHPAGVWPLDRRINTPQQIRQQMVKDNCIAHPSIMAKAAVLKQHLYHADQPKREDHDLWLRLLSEGYVIGKISKPLLLYRVHAASVTRTDARQVNIFMKLFETKYVFLKNQLKQRKWGLLECRVALYMLADLVKALLKAVKKSVRHVLSPKHS